MRGRNRCLPAVLLLCFYPGVDRAVAKLMWRQPHIHKPALTDSRQSLAHRIKVLLDVGMLASDALVFVTNMLLCHLLVDSSDGNLLQP